jgi:DNA-directed RNA polymerase subunit RPC12/RpoP
MSEFKYACPVCGQHMMCDESQAGTVMDCPTCFQKIVAPQAPAPGSKFILTGSKYTEKKITAALQDRSIIEPPKKFPAALVVGLILGFMALAAAAIYWTTIVHPRRVAKPPPAVATNAGNVKAEAPAKPALVAPPASDANWSLVLGTNVIPETAVAGRIHAQDFIIERASFSTNGTLTLRSNAKGQFEFGCTINFGGVLAESLASQTINVLPDADKAAKISLRWKDVGGAVQRENFDSGYAMRLVFGPLANNKLPGKIYLCTPDTEKSYLLGAFTAGVSRPKAPAKK